MRINTAHLSYTATHRKRVTANAATLMNQLTKMLFLRATVLLATLTVMLTLAGCASRESKLVGQWKMDASAMGKMPEGKTPQEKMGMEMAKKMFENVTLDLKEDNTFSMNMMMEFSGNWKLDDSANTVSLDMTKMAGMDIGKMPNAGKNQQPMVMTLGADNKTLTLQTPGGAPTPGGTMKFIKQ